MKKILSMLIGFMFFLGFSFATNVNKDVLNKMEKEIQQKYGVSIDIKIDIPKEEAKRTTADILFWIDFKKHKMQDFVRETLSPIFTHSDTDQCRNRIKPLLRTKKNQEALETYLKCIDNVLNNNIVRIINRGKKVGIEINTYNLFNVKRKISEIENKEKKQLEELKIKKQLEAKQKELEKEKKAKEEMEKVVKGIKNTLKNIFYIILGFIIGYIIIYFLRRTYLNIKINKILKLLDKNLIYLKNINYMDTKDYIDKINVLKEKIINFKKTLEPNNENIKKLEEIEKETNNINSITLEIIDTEKNIEKKTDNLKDKFNKLFK